MEQAEGGLSMLGRSFSSRHPCPENSDFRQRNARDDLEIAGLPGKSITDQSCVRPSLHHPSKDRVACQLVGSTISLLLTLFGKAGQRWCGNSGAMGTVGVETLNLGALGA